MESGAVAQCCYMRNIPFQIIRAISDSAKNQTEHTEYDRLLNEASAKASKVTQFLIENY
jgi:adenosylhomocysteine nucleosidase